MALYFGNKFAINDKKLMYSSWNTSINSYSFKDSKVNRRDERRELIVFDYVSLIFSVQCKGDQWTS